MVKPAPDYGLRKDSVELYDAEDGIYESEDGNFKGSLKDVMIYESSHNNLERSSSKSLDIL